MDVSTTGVVTKVLLIPFYQVLPEQGYTDPSALKYDWETVDKLLFEFGATNLTEVEVRIGFRPYSAVNIPLIDNYLSTEMRQMQDSGRLSLKYGFVADE